MCVIRASLLLLQSGKIPAHWWPIGLNTSDLHHIHDSCWYYSPHCIDESTLMGFLFTIRESSQHSITANICIKWFDCASFYLLHGALEAKRHKCSSAQRRGGMERKARQSAYKAQIHKEDSNNKNRLKLRPLRVTMTSKVLYSTFSR